MTGSSNNISDDIIRKYLNLFLLFLFASVLIYWLRNYISGGLGSIVIYTLFKPLMKMFHSKYKIGLGLSAILIMIISFIIIVIPFSLIIMVLTNKLSAFFSDTSNLNFVLAEISSRVKSLPFQVDIQGFISQGLSYGGTIVTSIVSNVFGGITTIVVMYFLLYFLLIGYNKFEENLVRYLPFHQLKLEILGKEINDQIFSNAIGMAIVSSCQGILAYFIYLIGGVNDAGSWGLLTGVCSIIPVVGTAIVWIPIVIFTYLTGHIGSSVFLLITSAIVLGNIDNIIRLIVSRSIAHIHPAITIFGVFFGLPVFGLLGVIFGPLILSSFFILYRLYFVEFGANKSEISDALLAQEFTNAPSSEAHKEKDG